MNAIIKNPSFNEIDGAFKNLNITSLVKIKNESITSDELLLFKPKILQAIDYIREKRKCPDTNAISLRKKCPNAKFFLVRICCICGVNLRI